MRCSRFLLARQTDAGPPLKKYDSSAGQARMVDKLATNGTAFPSSLEQSGGPRQFSVAHSTGFGFNAQHEGLPFAGRSPNPHGREVYLERVGHDKFSFREETQFRDVTAMETLASSASQGLHGAQRSADPFRLTPPEPFVSFRSANSLLKKAVYVPRY